MSTLAIISGTGLASLDGLTIIEQRTVITPFGEPSSDILVGEYHGKSVMFLPRHGQDHSIAPHRINYRANLWALHQQGVTEIIAIAAVGGIHSDLAPAMLAVPDHIIDYTHNREQSFHSDEFSSDKHIDFSYPYDQALRERILAAAKHHDLPIIDGGIYGATQGPRLETAAEINRMARDGCDMVGMTGMPEACLARELGIAYATCAVVANWAAGLGDGEITMAEIEQTLTSGISQIKQLLAQVLENNS